MLPKHIFDKYDCFCDGGGHFWNKRLEFGSNHRVRLLDALFPSSKFILNVRNLDSWLISKIKHAGWSTQTKMISGRPEKLEHENWRVKSIDVIIEWVVNRNTYHQRVLEYFRDRPSDLLIVNFVEDDDSVQRILTFLGIQNDPLLKPWEGKSSTNVQMKYYQGVIRKAFSKMELPESEWIKPI